MDLRAKTFLIIGLTLLGGIILIILFSFTLLNDSYAKFEKDNVKQNVLKGLKVLNYEEGQIISLTGDWSRWDETYHFVLDKNDKYISRNINYVSIENLGVDFLLYLRKDNSLKYAAQINATNQMMSTIPSDTAASILSIPGFLTFESILDVHSGFIILPDGPALIVSEPIITSTYQGPSVGTLIIGIYLDESEVEVLSEIADLSIGISPAAQEDYNYHNFSGLYNENNPNILVSGETEETITGSVFLETLNSNGSLQFTVTQPRDIIKQGKETIFTYIIILMVLGLVIILVSLITIDRLVLSRLHALIEKIKNRNQERIVTTDVLLEGDDEFSDLAREIDPVFLELNRSKRQLEEHVRLLTESERKYRDLADFLPEFVFESDINGKISFLNQMGLDVSGYCRNDFKTGLHLLNLLDSRDHPRFFSALQVIRGGTTISGDEYTGLKKNGDTFPMIVYASPIWSDSQVVGFRGFAIDISERKEIESSLRKLADIVEYTSTGIVTGIGNQVDYVNAAYSAMHGMQPGDFIGKSPFIVVTGYPEKNFTPYLENALHSGHATFELEHIRQDGSRFPVLHDLTVFTGTEVQNSVWSLNIQNITEQRVAWKTLLESEALRESARQLRDVISRLPDATFVIDKDGWVIFWNQAMEMLTGIRESDIVGRGKYEYAIPFYGEKRPMLLNAVLDKGGSLIHLFPDANKSMDSLFTDELFPEMGKGGKYFSSMAGPIYDSKGNIIGAIQSMRDITSRIMAEKALMRTNEKLNLLSSITRHDIRNRVTVILGLLPLLKEARDDPETGEIVRILDSAARLIHAQIEFTKVYQDLGIHAPEWKNVGELVRKASEVGIPGKVQVENDLSGLFVYADPLLERVFYNLIDNALRHGGDALTKIRFSQHYDETGFSICCEDDGVGIPEDLKKMIFDRGYGSNTGLGLFLVREILSITGIEILETGTAGRGARFEIRIPPGGYSDCDSKKE